MADIRKGITCNYCGAIFTIKYSDELDPIFCAFCSENVEDPIEELDDDYEEELDDDYEEDTDDLD